MPSREPEIDQLLASGRPGGRAKSCLGFWGASPDAPGRAQEGQDEPQRPQESPEGQKGAPGAPQSRQESPRRRQGRQGRKGRKVERYHAFVYRRGVPRFDDPPGVAGRL